MVLEIAVHFHLFLTSGSIVVNFLWSSERTVNVFLSLCLIHGSALWIEEKVYLSQQHG